MKFIIYTPNYTPHCAGICALHDLAWDLQYKGHQVQLAWATEGNRSKPIPFLLNRTPENDSIAIYPEIIPDNPLGLQKRVRWILSPMGQDWKDARKNDLLVSWGEWDENPVLCVPLVDQNIFNTSFVGNRTLKFTYKLTPRNDEIELHDYHSDWHGLASLFKRGLYLRCGDNNTNVNEMARLCGCPVILTEKDRNIKFIGGPLGIAFSDEEIDKARQELELFPREYDKYLVKCQESVDSFIKLCEERWK